MYDLINFSKKELSLTIAAYDYQINDKKSLVKEYSAWGEDLSRLMKGTVEKLQGEIEILIECKVRAITAFGIVSDRERILSQ